jgi:putative N6-adenine-specific DNA methylase
VDLDASGAPLHERGWRVAQGPAPLKETLAAAMVEMVGWTGQGRLHDPMAGAGTLVVEAVNRALGIAPGCTRSFGIERWPLHGAVMTHHLDDQRDRAVEHAQKVLAKPQLDVLAGDVDPASLRALRDNLASAGLEHVVEVEQRDATELPVPPKGSMLVANPPYGERIGADVETLYRRLGMRWRTFAGTTAWLVDGHPGFAAAFDERPLENHGLWNGPLPVQWRRFGW